MVTGRCKVGTNGFGSVRTLPDFFAFEASDAGEGVARPTPIMIECLRPRIRVNPNL